LTTCASISTAAGAVVQVASCGLIFDQEKLHGVESLCHSYLQEDL